MSATEDATHHGNATKPGASVAYQGEPGAFSEGAAAVLAPGFTPSPQSSFLDVVRRVERGIDAAGVLPVENTLAGGVTAAFDALLAGSVEVVGEVVLPIRHFLMAIPGVTAEELSEVRSHPVALAQCRDFFAERPDVRAVAVHDTAGAARAVAASGTRSIAAIAPQGAAARYGLAILAGDLQDRDDNQTRFLSIARPGAPIQPPFVEGPPWKTALVVETRNRPGALRNLLAVFADRSLDLTYIESRPAGTPWTYRFVLEFRHETRDEGDACIGAAAEAGHRVQRFGSYGVAPTPRHPGDESGRRQA